MMRKELVLVTRTGAAGRQLLRKLQADGWPAVDASPLTLEGPAEPDQLRGAFKRLTPCDRLILTSAESVRRSVELLGAETLSACPLVVPGPGTRDVANSLGLKQVVCPKSVGNSESMLALAELKDVKGLRVIILAAAGGRQLLAKTLAARGAMVDCLHVYRRLPRRLPEATLAALAQARSSACLLASAGALHGLKEQLDPELWQRVINGVMVAPSPRVAELAEKMGGSRVERAASADNVAMLEALYRLL